MGPPLDDIAFLARSESRLAILRALEKRARDRRELKTETGISRSTLGRALGELEAHGWIERNGQTYETTTAGGLVLDQFASLLETLGGIQTLGDGLRYLPVEEMALDVRHFNDARLVTPTEFDPTEAFQYGIERMHESDTVRSVARTVPPPYVRAIHEDVTAGELAAEMILDSAYLDVIKDSDMAGPWRRIAANAEIRRYEQYIPYRLIILDDVVHLWLCSDEGEQSGLLESEDPTVREWAESVYEEYRIETEPLDSATLSEE
ncbi:MAG: helix-turn-helix domain-containing protein [Haloarculaceae archaeon]